MPKTTRPATSKRPPSSGYPEFSVRREFFNRYFDAPIPSSTFYDLVNNGKIVPMKHLKGFFLLNESLRRMGLREERELPKDPRQPSLEDITRLAFTLMDPHLFPDPPWMLFFETIDPAVFEHARLIVEKHIGALEDIDQNDQLEIRDKIVLKLQYFAGVLDAAAMLQTDYATEAA